MENIKFEEAKDEHLSEILDIYNYYVRNSTATFHLHDISTDGMRELLFFDNPKYKAFAIKNGDCLCGYCILSPFKKREAYDITAEITIYLKHDYIGKGVGSMAIRHLEKFAKENGFHSLIAVVCGENENSMRMFERNGYLKCGQLKEVGIKFGRMLDIIYYQKILR